MGLVDWLIALMLVEVALKETRLHTRRLSEGPLGVGNPVRTVVGRIEADTPVVVVEGSSHLVALSPSE